MSEQPEAAVPDWDLADRMRKALRHADMGVAEMADYLGVSRTSVSNWINGRVEPSLQTLRLWSLRTGVSLEWVLERELIPTMPLRIRRAPIFTPVPGAASVTRIHPELAA